MSGFSFAGTRARGARGDWRRLLRRFVLTLPVTLCLAGCLGYDGDIQRGYVVDDQTLAQVKIGMPAEKVQDIMGNPSTTSTIGGGSWYYISQIVHQTLRFMKPKVVDQRVLVVYFDRSNKVQRIANYGLQDGKVFDFISRTTPTGGAEQTFLNNIFRSFLRFG